jgi:hypothetical protein
LDLLQQARKVLVPSRTELSCSNPAQGRDANQHTTVLCYFALCFFYLVCEAIGTAATPDLLCQTRVIVEMIVEKQVECRLAGETEVLGENLPTRHFCPSQNPT